MYVKERYEYQGKLYTLTELTKMSDLCRDTIMKRLRNGWPVEKAIHTPPGREKPEHTAADLGKIVPIVFRSLPPVTQDMQPILGKQYMATVCGSARKSSVCRIFYKLKLDNGKVLITYPGEFEMLDKAK